MVTIASEVPLHPVVERAQLSPNVTRLVVAAPRIAQVRQPGQFVIVRLGIGAERIPLTIADADPTLGTITLVIQSVGKTTMDLCALAEGDAITDIAGPLGRPTELITEEAVCVGGGVGTAVVLPSPRARCRRRAGDLHHRRAITPVGDLGGRAARFGRRDRVHR